MTLYIAVDGVDSDALDAADDELIADTIHQLLNDEVLVQDIETVGIVENLKDELEEAVISENSLQILAGDVSHSIDGPGITPEHRETLIDAVDEAHNALLDEAHNALHGNGDTDD